MKLKPLAETMFYVFAEATYGRQVWLWPLGIHARHGVTLQVPRGAMPR